MTTAGTARPREHKSPMSKQQSAVSHELIEHIALTISPDKTLPSAESTKPTGVMMLTSSHANLAIAPPQAIDTRKMSSTEDRRKPPNVPSNSNQKRKATKSQPDTAPQTAELLKKVSQLAKKLDTKDMECDSQTRQGYITNLEKQVREKDCSSQIQTATQPASNTHQVQPEQLPVNAGTTSRAIVHAL